MNTAKAMAVRNVLNTVPLDIVDAILDMCVLTEHKNKMNILNDEFTERVFRSPVSLWNDDFLDHVNHLGIFVRCYHPCGLPITSRDVVFFLTANLEQDQKLTYFDQWVSFILSRTVQPF